MPNRIVSSISAAALTVSRSALGTSSYPDYLDVRRRTRTLEHVYARMLFPQTMSLAASTGAEQRRRRGRHDELLRDAEDAAGARASVRSR